MHHSQQDSSGWVISSSQRPLPDNTQHSQQTSMPPGGIWTHHLSRRTVAKLRLRPRGHWEVMPCRNIKFYICIWYCLGKSYDFITTICLKFFYPFLYLLSKATPQSRVLLDIHSYSRSWNFQFLQNQKVEYHLHKTELLPKPSASATNVQ